MTYRFEFRPIARKFLRSLTTSHGIWDIREAIIIRLIDDTGKVGWGEIAPISWFGSETLAQALDFCRQLPAKISNETIFSIPDNLPACQFGFESAFEGLGVGDCAVSLSYSGLLAAGEVALEQWKPLWLQGFRTFKWKIGVQAIAQELAIFDSLTHSLPAASKLRLDANGGLSYDEAELWLQRCDNLQENAELSLEIEFIEQPLAVEQFSGMLELSQCYKTAIALDESVATIQQLEACFQQGWRDIFVIKPSIAGSPSRLRKFFQKYKIDAVFSSVFETAIGRQAALKLAAELSQNNRAVGFGISHFFEQEATCPQRLWNNL